MEHNSDQLLKNIFIQEKQQSQYQTLSPKQSEDQKKDSLNIFKNFNSKEENGKKSNSISDDSSDIYTI